ncbi:unnamed protein product [Pseudo-nitzschia multistriata]|uniref:Uncharacterized protein n=1 Tax=Pseudo-nitzschia multistriata TaxID=183589 RepID=A0A448ZSX6_9STRA|nr:unnamed protein product [Pseudo-nitzschia multistriata]
MVQIASSLQNPPVGGRGPAARPLRHRSRRFTAWIRPCLATSFCGLVAVWWGLYYHVLLLHKSEHQLVSGFEKQQQQQQQQQNRPHQQKQKERQEQQRALLLSPEAYPVYGTHMELEWNGSNKNGNNEQNNGNGNSISMVYAVPSRSTPGRILATNKPPSATGTADPLGRIRGVVVLLHACTHSALKFFAPSEDSCPSCVGLSEEMRLARIVLERGYAALAVTCSNAKSGCWGGHEDVRRIQHALREFWRASVPMEAGRDPGALPAETSAPVYAIGASSGGAMAAKLVAEGVARSATVMVMALRDQLLDRLLALPHEHKLYLAPMVRDKGTTNRVRKNYQYITKQQEQRSREDPKSTAGNNHHDFQVVLDETSCKPLPVTSHYLWNRVPGMTLEAAQIIVDVLLRHGHLDPSTHLFLIDPTRSNWRDHLLETRDGGKDNSSNHPGEHNNKARPPSLELPQRDAGPVQQRPKNDGESQLLLWGTFDLTPGMSPLAKALHRAWAFHEYCSEVVEKSLDFFEGTRKGTQ